MKTSNTILTCSPKPRHFKLRNILTGEIESFCNIRETAKRLGRHPTHISFLLAQKVQSVENYVLPERELTAYKLFSQEKQKEVIAVEAKKSKVRSVDIIRLTKNRIKLIKSSCPNPFNGLTYISEIKYESVKVNRLPKPSRIKSQVSKPKSFRLKNALTGKITEHKSVHKFAFENQLSCPSLFAVLSGKRKSAGNYCLPETKVELFDVYDIENKKWEKVCNLNIKGFKWLKAKTLKQLKANGRLGNWVTVKYLRKHEYEIDLSGKN